MSSPMQVTDDKAAVESISRLSRLFAQTAEETDRLGPLNGNIRRNIHQLVHIGFLGASISKKYGGLELSATAQRESLKILASACGVTAFTQQQLHAGGNFVGKSDDEGLKRELLPQFADGSNICGVGFSHLRRPGPPKVNALRTPTGFTINGQLPWISAWSLLDSFILGATINDGRMIYCYLPIKEFRNNLFASNSLRLSTLDASETVQLDINDLQIPQRYVLSEHPADHMTSMDFRGITNHIELPLGCALGSAAFLRALGQSSERTFLIDAATKIEKKAAELEADSLYWNSSRSDEIDYLSRALKARTGVIILAIDAASAGVAAAGGSAHLTTSPAQRRFRESAFYATQAQTLDIQQTLMEAFING